MTLRAKKKGPLNAHHYRSLLTKKKGRRKPALLKLPSKLIWFVNCYFAALALTLLNAMLRRDL